MSDKVKTFGERFNEEIEAAHAAMDRKERELDEHGYGGDPSKPAAQVVGLDFKNLKKDDTAAPFLYPRLDRPPREDYVRVTISAHGFTIEPAVEYRDGDDFDKTTRVLKSIAGEVAVRPLGGQMPRAHECGEIIQRCWPDRAYFVEVWQEGSEGFAQVFQPFGIPRNR